ncbi:33159_t:CDS:2 [Gigaspora margarita]|uniref:33159_t:CDS:1 n=1 Tax=Gigaspora margarita TaxID=4874 RepID=A0ABN7X0L9_GIGMA|nr:33159_t:CDS:2 [Gigaspora margarita]
MRKASSKLAENVADIQEKLEILKAKKEYINYMINETRRKKTNLGSLTQLDYMGQISFLEAEIKNIKNFKLQKNLIELIQVNEQLLADIFKLENLGTYAGNQINETIDSFVAEEVIQKMNEIQANWKKKENYMKNDNKYSRLMRVVSIDAKDLNNEDRYAKDLKNAETEVESLTSDLKQVFKVAAKSCNIEKMQYETKKTNLDTQIKNLKKNDDYKKLEHIKSDLINENNRLANIKSKQYKIINRREMKNCSYEFLLDLQKKINISEYLTKLENIIKEP